MNRTYTLCSLIMLVAFDASAAAPIVGAPFHPATTTAEQQLDKVLKRSATDSSMFGYVAKSNEYNPLYDSEYANLFTEDYVKAVSQYEARLVQQQCHGKYIDGEICGLDYNPVNCSQDAPQKYRYRTVSSNNEKDVIQATPDYGSKENTPANTTQQSQMAYELKHLGGMWKINGVDCGDNQRFNIDNDK